MTPPRPNPLLTAVSSPPIAQADKWTGAYDGRHGPLINCSQAVPNHAPPAAFSARLAEAAGSPAAARYGEILGDAALRAAYAGHVSKIYGAPIEARQIAITAGCNQAFFAAMIAVAGAGDAVVLPTPWYFNHQMTLDMLGIEKRALATKAENGFLPDPEDFEALIDGRTRALVLVSPNNPTGAVYPPTLIAELFRVCVRRGLYLVLDETYRDFLPPSAGTPHALFADPRAETNLVGLYSFSKAYAIPGHRLGALIGGGAIVGEIEKVVDNLQICAPRPPQAALPWAIDALADWRTENAAAIASRARLFAAMIGEVPGWTLDQIGAYFAYVRHPFPDRPAATVAAELARDFGILALPGSFFGPDQDGHLRIAFANVPEDGIREVMRRLALGGASDQTAPAKEVSTDG
ncbi:aminotransferase [Jiella avicenniae]|uniref:Aminotransferase n=1 Tax=Jiella avicenniae TaxID=2907202 RepID=A0A9X1P435_9HYPH|nr:aminotransferase [Jiella avicenniae]MCE7030083.1 aminotransferase [Jiella avicenniae]